MNVRFRIHFMAILSICLLALVGCNENQSKTASQPTNQSETERIPIKTSTAFPSRTMIVGNVTPTATKTEIPVLSLSITPTTRKDTQTPTATTPTELPPGHLLLAVSDISFNAVTLVDVQTGYRRDLNIPESPPITVYRWSENGCELIVKLFDGRIVRVGIDGNIKKVLFSEDQILNVQGGIRYESVSPTEEWVVYTVLTGKVEGREQRYEFQDIEVVAVDGEFGPYRLTQRGGAWAAKWSPDGKWLAYSDRDYNGFVQIYASEPDGENRVQLTHNDDPAIEIVEIEWSPDSSLIAFHGIENETNIDKYVGVAKVKQDNAQVTSLDIKGYTFWWQDPKILVILGQPVESLGSQGMGFYWIDVNSNVVTHQFLLSENEITSASVYLPQPVSDKGLIGFFGGNSNDFFLFDPYMKTIDNQPWLSGMFLVSHWKAAPLSFPGETNCTP